LGYEFHKESSEKTQRILSANMDDVTKYTEDFDYRFKQDEEDGNLDIAINQYREISKMFNYGNDNVMLQDKKQIARLMYILEHITGTAEWEWDYAEHNLDVVNDYLEQVSNAIHVYPTNKENKD
jgi:hypothetical protein